MSRSYFNQCYAATPSAIDKYVGTWLGECDTTFRERTRFVASKSSDTVASFSALTTQYSDTACSTNASTVDTTTGTFTLNGTKTVGADTVDKIDVSANSSSTGSVSYKDVIKFTPTQFQLGNTDSGAPLDLQGYPNQLDPKETYVKQ